MSHGVLSDAALAAVRERIASDLRPVKPARIARWLWAVLSSFGAASFLVMCVLFGLREDHEVLGNLWSLGLTGCQFLAAFVLLAVTLREACPGRYSDRVSLGFLALAALTTHVFTTWLTFLKSPLAAPEGAGVNYSLVCLGLEIALGLPIGLFALRLLARGVVSRPLLAGIVGGLGAGLAGDAVWRLICPFSDPAHVLTSHTLGILAVSLLTFGVAAVWEGRRLRAWRLGVRDVTTMSPG